MKTEQLQGRSDPRLQGDTDPTFFRCSQRGFLGFGGQHFPHMLHRPVLTFQGSPGN
jgi:hypothetical protein